MGVKDNWDLQKDKDFRDKMKMDFEAQSKFWQGDMEKINYGNDKRADSSSSSKG